MGISRSGGALVISQGREGLIGLAPLFRNIVIKLLFCLKTVGVTKSMLMIMKNDTFMFFGMKLLTAEAS
jgi:hypothetical protein